MPFVILVLILILGFLLKASYISIPLENNGAVFLYNARFGKKELNSAGQWLFVAVLEWLYGVFYKKDSNDYAWLRIALAVMNSIATVLVFFIACFVWKNDYAGLFSAGLFAIFASVPHLIPWFTNAERLSTVFSSAGFLLICLSYASVSNPSFLVLSAGVSFGLAFLSKIPSLAETGVLCAAFLVFSANITNWILLPAGFALPIVVHIIIVICKKRSYEYTKLFAGLMRYKSADVSVERGYHTKSRPKHPSFAFFADIFAGSSIVWIFGFTTIIAIIINGLRSPEYGLPVLCVAWLCGAFLGITVQRVWTPGHWTAVMPPLCVLAGKTANDAFFVLFHSTMPWYGSADIYMGILAGTVVIFGIAMAIITSRDHSWGAKSRKPFQSDILKIGNYIKSITRDGDYIMAWGWHPQVYVFAGRPSAVSAHLFYCHAPYQEKVTPEWRDLLLKGFLRSHPALLVVDDKTFPFNLITNIIGAKFILNKETPRELKTSIYKIIYDPSVPCPDENAVDSVLSERIRSLFAAAEKDVAEHRCHIAYPVLLALRNVSAEREKIESMLDDINLGWKFLPEEHGVLPDIACKVETGIAPDGGRFASLKEVGQEISLNSKYAPLKEAERFAESISKKNYDVVFVFGTGLGYQIKTILDKMPLSTQVIAIERRRQIYDAMKSVNNFSEAIKSGRLKIFVSLNPANTEMVCRQVLRPVSGSDVQNADLQDTKNFLFLVCSNTASTQMDTQYYEQARQVIFKYYTGQ
ncbi:MAG: motility associated factor glycosyltransferase family protein [Planctomycetes bacterium]|nr:motility associated factor glycosyltransferase family protein [Planctomycetota bacterium]